MMESYAYELIKKEGYEEGIRSGLQQGTLEATREHILETLEARFKDVPKNILQSIRKIQDPDALKLLFRKALRADSLDEFHKALSSFLD
jgi:flagellar biosynthesis/type III secretory pathway protein FliH